MASWHSDSLSIGLVWSGNLETQQENNECKTVLGEPWWSELCERRVTMATPLPPFSIFAGQALIKSYFYGPHYFSGPFRPALQPFSHQETLFLLHFGHVTGLYGWPFSVGETCFNCNKNRDEIFMTRVHFERDKSV